MSVALVTGAAQGIGAAVARALLKSGARVAALDVQPAGLAELSGDAPQRGSLWTATVDVGDEAAVATTVGQAEQALGPITQLASVAGILRTGDAVDSSASDWHACMTVNAAGVRNVLVAVARRMQPRRQGAIVTVASNAANTPRAGMSAYAASKAAAVAFTKCLGLELAPHGIRCNVVSPGSTDTPMQHAMWSDTQGAARVIAGDPERFKLGIPLARIAAPDDVVDAVLFLLSERARHITMHELCVDGGATLGR